MREKQKKSKGISRETIKDGHAALMILVSFLLPIRLCRFMFLRMLSFNRYSLCPCTDYSAKIKLLRFDTCILRHIEVIKVSLVVGSPYCKTERSCTCSNHICNSLPIFNIKVSETKPFISCM